MASKVTNGRTGSTIFRFADVDIPIQRLTFIHLGRQIRALPSRLGPVLSNTRKSIPRGHPSSSPCWRGINIPDRFPKSVPKTRPRNRPSRRKRSTCQNGRSTRSTLSINRPFFDWFDFSESRSTRSISDHKKQLTMFFCSTRISRSTPCFSLLLFISVIMPIIGHFHLKIQSIAKSITVRP